jgi:hypothetical protein
MLHGKESVMTEKQMADLVTNAKATGSNQTMQQMMQQALSSVKGTKADNQRTVSTDTDQSSKLQTTDLSRLLENTVNSVKGVSGLSTKMSDQLSSLSQAIVSNKDKSSQTVNPPSTSDTSTSSNASASPSAAELASVFSAAKPVAPTVPSAAELASVFSAAKPVAPAAPVPVPAKPVAETKTIMPARSDASLNDVVASLNQLNSKMGQLLDSHTDIGNKQLRAVQSNNANLFAR